MLRLQSRGLRRSYYYILEQWKPWHVQHDNLMLWVNLTCLRKCKMSGLHGGALLSAPGIFSLPNNFRPCFLSTAGLSRFHSLSASRSSAFWCSTSAILFWIYSWFFLRFSYICSSCSIRCHLCAVHLTWRSTWSLSCSDCSVSNHCTKSHRGGGVFPQIILEVITRSESGKLW